MNFEKSESLMQLKTILPSSSFPLPSFSFSFPSRLRRGDPSGISDPSFDRSAGPRKPNPGSSGFDAKRLRLPIQWSLVCGRRGLDLVSKAGSCLGLPGPMRSGFRKEYRERCDRPKQEFRTVCRNCRPAMRKKCFLCVLPMSCIVLFIIDRPLLSS